MELTKEPVTELEHWEIIEGLGGFIWNMEHDIFNKRIEPTELLLQEIKEAREIQQRIVNQACEKFNVVFPPQTPFGKKAPPPPEGKTYYWPWYYKMKDISLRGQYEQMICSSCVFSRGVEEFLAMSRIPCSLCPGLIRLARDTDCYFVSFGKKTEEEMRERIRAEHGAEALRAYDEKKAKLMAASAEAKTG